jgi:hypothetical protein
MNFIIGLLPKTFCRNSQSKSYKRKGKAEQEIEKITNEIKHLTQISFTKMLLSGDLNFQKF